MQAQAEAMHETIYAALHLQYHNPGALPMLEYSMFERLPFRSQAEVIAKAGTIVASRHYNNWQITLYELNNHFVELWTGEQAQVFSTFKDAANKVTIFEPYLDGMYIPELDDE